MTAFVMDELDAEDVPLEDRVAVARKLDVLFDPRASAIESAVLAMGVDASSWVTGSLVVLVHDHNTWPIKTALRVNVNAMDLDPLRPQELFVGPELASVKIDDSTPRGDARVTLLSGPYGAQLLVTMTWEADLEATSPLSATVSVYLIGQRHRIDAGLLLLPDDADEPAHAVRR